MEIVCVKVYYRSILETVTVRMKTTIQNANLMVEIVVDQMSSHFIVLNVSAYALLRYKR